MILFKEYHVDLILRGIKTQTRRIWQKRRCRPNSIHKAKTEMLSKDSFAELYITDVHQEHLLDITEGDAWKEGGYTRKEFLEIWDEINPKMPSETNPKVYVVTFVVSHPEIKRAWYY